MSYKILVLSLAMVFISSCKEQDQKATENIETEEISEINKKGLNGTWELVGFYNYKDNVVLDSFSNNTISRQIKMYTDSKVMWCKLLKTDSIEFFGYGSYNYNDDGLTEVLEFGSAFMNEIIEEQQEFNFKLELSEDRFEQIEIDEDGNKIYSENYKRVE
ncbi:hypothetical protein [Winogradskyella thalassocola]|uniref:Lipocalin-like domain-containing protein n=1 Tax=Winogradskyella thalassocola TaxID=262004 RepID=A0A1G8G671_9FLAO|nr:hypothetical protein [Winogradskyella thalassocola]SDH89904.1 hypothetical protein SAMN04489796_105109 [Winogradskyella thalassocola]